MKAGKGCPSAARNLETAAYAELTLIALQSWSVAVVISPVNATTGRARFVSVRDATRMRKDRERDASRLTMETCCVVCRTGNGMCVKRLPTFMSDAMLVRMWLAVLMPMLTVAKMVCAFQVRLLEKARWWGKSVHMLSARALQNCLRSDSTLDSLLKWQFRVRTSDSELSFQ